jgi:integrase
LHYSNWRRRVWVPATAAAGLPGLHFHDLRHTATTALVEEGVDIKTAQTRLGLSEQVMLRVYAQATERADREAAGRVGDRFRPPVSVSRGG